MLAVAIRICNMNRVKAHSLIVNCMSDVDSRRCQIIIRSNIHTKGSTAAYELSLSMSDLHHQRHIAWCLQQRLTNSVKYPNPVILITTHMVLDLTSTRFYSVSISKSCIGKSLATQLTHGADTRPLYSVQNSRCGHPSYLTYLLESGLEHLIKHR